MTKRKNGEWLAFLQTAARAVNDECIEGGGKSRPTIQTPDGRQMHASRYVWLLANGDPGDLFVLHTCDNKLCVNIRHLYLGSQTQNVADMWQRDRRSSIRYARGERAGRARLTADKVRAIRKRYESGESQTVIAADYGVTQEAISAVIRRKSWAHISD